MTDGVTRREYDGAKTSLVSLVVVPRAASGVAVLTGCVVLAGWLFGIELFKSVVPGLVAMNPVTALAFILLGFSLWLSTPQPTVRRRRAAQAGAGVVALIGLLKLSESFFGWEIGVDRLLFRDALEVIVAGRPNRMAPNTALNFLLLGCVVLLFDVKMRRGLYPAQLLLILSALGSLLPALGYIYGVKSFYGVGSFIPMALHTAVTFLVLVVGFSFARPDRGIAPLMRDEGVAGIMARRLLPAAVIIPILLGWLRLKGERLGFYDVGLGVALFVVTTTLIFAVLVWWNARLLWRVDAKRMKAEEALRELSLTDDLTGLRNRRGFFTLAEQQLKIARKRRADGTLLLVYLDMDGLKEINDRFGHHEGSAAIANTAEIIKRTFRDTDIAARLGGDEFAILVVDAAPGSDRLIAERLRRNLTGYNDRNLHPYRLSVSVGVARLDAYREASLEEVMAEADRAMYEQKQGKKLKFGHPNFGNSPLDLRLTHRHYSN